MYAKILIQHLIYAYNILYIFLISKGHFLQFSMWLVIRVALGYAYSKQQNLHTAWDFSLCFQSQRVAKYRKTEKIGCENSHKKYV